MSDHQPTDPPPVLAHAYAEVMRRLLRREAEETEQSEEPTLTTDPDTVR